MKNKLLILMMVCGLSLPAFSQTSDSVQYKNQLGVITGPGAPIGVIYKRQVKQNQAWRITVSGNLRKQTNPVGSNNSNPQFYKHKFTDFYLQELIGYEWKYNFSNKGTFYYGADAGFGVGKSSTDYEFDDFNPNPSNPLFFQRGTSNSQNYILKPMAGIAFKLHSKLSLALESCFTLNYSRTRIKNYDITYPENQDNPTIIESKASSQSFGMGFSPVSNIQLVYKF